MVLIILFIGLLKTVFWLLIIFYGVRLVVRYVVPFVFRKTLHDMQSRMQQQFREQQRQGKREGEVTLENNRPGPARQNHGGEYVDFEEVD